MEKKKLGQVTDEEFMRKVEEWHGESEKMKKDDPHVPRYDGRGAFFANQIDLPIADWPIAGRRVLHA